MLEQDHVLEEIYPCMIISIPLFKSFFHPLQNVIKLWCVRRHEEKIISWVNEDIVDEEDESRSAANGFLYTNLMVLGSER